MRATLSDRRVITVIVWAWIEALSVTHSAAHAIADMQEAVEAGRRTEVQIPGTAVIRGTVSAADTGKPIPLAQVTLVEGRSVRTRTVTDAAGRYHFANLPAGQYRLGFAKMGFVSLTYGQKQPSDETKRVEVREGQKVDRIDIALSRASAIEGRVLDEAGDPVVAANVAVMRFQFLNHEQRLVPTGRPVKTNDRGEYRLFGLPPGDYAVSVSLSDAEMSFTDDPLQPSKRAASGYAPMFYPNTNDIGEAGRVSVLAGQNVSNIDIAFRPVPLVRITGSVLSAGGQLLDGAHVALVRATPPGGTLGLSRVAQNGVFRIDDVPPGKYVLHARSVPLSTIDEIATTGRSAPMSDAKGLEFGTLPITVSGVDLGDLNVTTAPAGRIRGRVLLDQEPFRPTAEHKLLVTAIPVGPDSIAAGATAQVVQTDGSFSVGGLIGTFVIRLEPLEPPLYLTRVERPGVEVTDTGVVVGPGEAVSDVSIVLSTTTTGLTGHVVSGAERIDFSDYTVVVFSSESARWSLPATRYVTNTRPDRQGLFHVRGLPPGRYLAFAAPSVAKDRGNDPDYLKGISKAATVVFLESGRTVTATLNVERAPRR